MSITSKKNTNNIAPAEATKTNYTVTVSNARIIAEDVVAFDMVANGVRIYGMIYRAGTKSDGEEYEMLSFPSRQATNEKYYSHCWFPISNKLKSEIISELEKLISVDNLEV